LGGAVVRAPETGALSGSSTGKDGAILPFLAMRTEAGCPV
jgi:hypothetical protein